MEAIELVVFIGVAIIIGGLIIGFITGIDTQQIYSAMKKLFLPEEAVRYTSVDADEMAPALYKVWRECGYGQRDHEQALSLRGDTPVNKQAIFQWYTKFNLCHSIQSATYDCGNREDIEMPETITPPALLRVTCNTNTEKLVITII